MKTNKNAPAGTRAQSKNYSSLHFTPTDPVRQFADAVFRDLGAIIDPIPDGKIHRFALPDKRRTSKPGWYVLHLDGVPAGAFGDWVSGYQSSWHAVADQPITLAERERIRQRVADAKERQQRETEAAQYRAADRALKLWNSDLASAMHPYLERKGISALGLRQHGEDLVVPLWDVERRLWNVQSIAPDGTKRFLYGGRIKGCFALCWRNLPEDGELIIAEGWATASTVMHATRKPTVAAMNAGNLLPVAQAIRAARPRLAITFAADNDHLTPGNPGISKAMQAAEAVHAAVTWPTVCGQSGCVCTDFNDTARCGRCK